MDGSPCPSSLDIDFRPDCHQPLFGRPAWCVLSRRSAHSRASSAMIHIQAIRTNIIITFSDLSKALIASLSGPESFERVRSGRNAAITLTTSRPGGGDITCMLIQPVGRALTTTNHRATFCRLFNSQPPDRRLFVQIGCHDENECSFSNSPGCHLLQTCQATISPAHVW